MRPPSWLYLPSQGIIGHGVRDSDDCQPLNGIAGLRSPVQAVADPSIRGRAPSLGRAGFGSAASSGGGGGNTVRRGRGESNGPSQRRPCTAAAREPSAAVKRILDDMAERAAQLRKKDTGQQDAKLSAAERMQALRRRIHDKSAAASAREDSGGAGAKTSCANSSCMASTGSPPTKEVVKMHLCPTTRIQDGPAGEHHGEHGGTMPTLSEGATGSSAEGGSDAAVAAAASRVAWESAGAADTAAGAS